MFSCYQCQCKEKGKELETKRFIQGSFGILLCVQSKKL